ncbi:MAG: SDR family oxidoreductase [Gammaproteobacteria bacterium]
MPSELRVGTVSSVTIELSPPMVEAFARLTGDRSPLHTEVDFARRSPYRDSVVHGMLPIAFLPLLDFLWTENGGFYPRELNGKFLAPVFAGDVLRLTAEVVAFQSPRVTIDYYVEKAKTGARITTGTARLELGPSGGAVAENSAEGGVAPAITEVLEPFRFNLEEIQKGGKDAFGFRVHDASIWGLKAILSFGDPDQSRLPGLERRFDLRGLLAVLLFSTSVGMRIPGRYATFLEFTARVESTLAPDEDYLLTGEVIHVSRSTRIVKKSIAVMSGTTAAISGKVSVMVSAPSLPMPSVRALREQALDLGLRGKTALVTGASRGIGETTVKFLALHGARVIVNYFRGETDANRIAAEIVREGGEALALMADVSDPAQVTQMVRLGIERFGSIDILVNNAVRDYRPASFLTLSWDDIQTDIDVIVKGAFHCCRAVVPSMTARGGGKIINVSTVYTDDPPPNQAKYVISKSALVGLTRSLAVELALQNIQVNMVVPSFVETDSVAHIPEAYRKQIARNNTMQRNASPVEVAQAILFLASSYSCFTTGQKVMVTGGRPYL